MADVAEKVLQETVENATETISGAKTPASPEGAAMAYGSLIIMAMLPIFFGALRSVKHQKDQKVYFCEFINVFLQCFVALCICFYNMLLQP